MITASAGSWGDLPEPNETVKLTLSNPSGGVLGLLSRATLTIEDNDGLTRVLAIRDRVNTTGFAWTIVEDIPWLSFSAVAGSGPGAVTVTADPTGLPPGTYNEFFTVTGNTGESPQGVEAILKVLP